MYLHISDDQATEVLIVVVPEDWAKDTWAILSAQGQRLLKDDQTLETAEDNLAELTAQAQAFAEKQWPILKALQIASNSATAREC